MTSLLGNSRYQTNRKIYDQSNITLCLAILWKPCTMQIPTGSKNLTLAGGWRDKIFMETLSSTLHDLSASVCCFLWPV